MFRSFAAAALFILSVTAARADSASVNVAYGDLNLARAADARILAQRLDGAARLACRDANAGERGFGARREMQQCVDAAIATAMSRIEADFDRAVRVYLVNARADQP